LLYLSSWRDLQRWSQATASWLFDKPEITPLPIPTNLATAPKFEKAADCLEKDRAALLAFYDFPAEHWKHLRTSNLRHRTIRSKGCLSNTSALAMVFKLVEAAQKSWRRLDGHNHLPKVILGAKFTDGLEVAEIARQPKAAA
jgi:hypothetical protein